MPALTVAKEQKNRGGTDGLSRSRQTGPRFFSKVRSRRTFFIEDLALGECRDLIRVQQAIEDAEFIHVAFKMRIAKSEVVAPVALGTQGSQIRGDRAPG